MKRTLQHKAFILLAGFTLIAQACGPSPAKITAAADMAAAQTQTAAPTRTPIPTATPTPGPQGLIAFTSDRDGADGVYVMNADGSGEPVVLAIHPFGESWPRWSPDGSKIVFQSFRADIDDLNVPNNMEIYVMNADGSGMRRLTDDPATDGEPSWSPDGAQIVFFSERDGNAELYLMATDGSGQTRLTDSPAEDRHPSWSPDGSRLAFTSVVDGNPEIYMINSDGSNLVRLTTNAAEDTFPAWSPNGDLIAFRSDRDGHMDIYVMKPDGSGLTRLTNDAAFEAAPAWSPDGLRITYSRGQEDGAAEIYVMNADGSTARNLTENAANDAVSSWSPAGNTIGAEPWFGAPFCVRDTDHDFQADLVSPYFLKSEMFGFVSFPFRNMEDGMLWSMVWYLEGSTFKPQIMSPWDGGESGFYTAFSGSNFTGTGVETIQLYIGDKLVQEIHCNLVTED